LRPFSVYGPRQPVNTGYVGALLGTLQASNQLVLPGQRTFTRDFVHIDTVVETVVAAIAAEGPLPPLINVGSGVRTSLSDLVGVFETVTGRRLDVTFVEPRPGTLRSTLSNPALMNEFASPKPIQLERGLAETIAAYIDES
jgi:UDP-glucose 4-epimerase